MTAGPPSHSTVPPSMGCTPAMVFTRVDLPAPLSPTRASTSPARTSRSMFFSAWTAPKRLETPRSASTVPVTGGEVGVTVIDQPPGALLRSGLGPGGYAVPTRTEVFLEADPGGAGLGPGLLEAG